MLTSEAERFDDAKSKDMAYSNVAPIPLYKEQGQQKYYTDSSGSGQERCPPKGTKEFPSFRKEGHAWERSWEA